MDDSRNGRVRAHALFEKGLSHLDRPETRKRRRSGPCPVRNAIGSGTAICASRPTIVPGHSLKQMVASPSTRSRLGTLIGVAAGPGAHVASSSAGLCPPPSQYCRFRSFLAVIRSCVSRGRESPRPGPGRRRNIAEMLSRPIRRQAGHIFERDEERDHVDQRGTRAPGGTAA